MKTLEEMCEEMGAVNLDRHLESERKLKGFNGRDEAFCPDCGCRVKVSSDKNGYPTLEFLEHRT